MSIIGMAKRAGRRLGVGFQLCFDPVMLQLKQLADSGELGRPVDMRGMVLWQRGFAYYARSGGWAGRRLMPDGTPVYDSILTNAAAHFLMNMLWLNTPGYGTLPALGCEAWLARAYPIETFDTAAARFTLPGGCSASLYASHVAGPENERHPTLRYRFERAEVLLDPVTWAEQTVTVVMRDGTVRRLGQTVPGVMPKLNGMARALETGEPLPCTGETALAEVQSAHLLFAQPVWQLTDVVRT